MSKTTHGFRVRQLTEDTQEMESPSKHYNLVYYKSENEVPESMQRTISAQKLPKFSKNYFPHRFNCLHWCHHHYPFSSCLAGKILLCFQCSPCHLRQHQVRHHQLHPLRLQPENGPNLIKWHKHLTVGDIDY
jgi:hypothetical protein